MLEIFNFLDDKPLQSFNIVITYRDLIYVTIILFLTWVIAKYLSHVFYRICSGVIERRNLLFIGKLGRWFIYIIGIILVCPFFGINMNALMVFGGAIGVSIGFASKDIISHAVAGVLILFERPVKLGDFIEVNGTEGSVEDIGIISTTIRLNNGVYVRIPNGSIFSSEITNYSTHIARRIQYSITIQYADDVNKVSKMITDFLEKYPYVLKLPAPFVYIETVGPNGYNVLIKIWAPTKLCDHLEDILLGDILALLKEQNIVIPYEQNVVWLNQINQS
ncbi:MAG TPA: mechanosensitive ion channel family protein [Methanocorpusculum sp.]|nr:mechanosensitive ion channel family protein [Methanocorpusculum sp.]